jgi:hypothetical protein
VALIAASRAGSIAPPVETIPQIPHMGRSLGGFGGTSLSRAFRQALLGGGSEEAAQRLSEHAPCGGSERAHVEEDRTVRDPLEVVRKLLGH